MFTDLEGRGGILEEGIFPLAQETGREFMLATDFGLGLGTCQQRQDNFGSEGGGEDAPLVGRVRRIRRVGHGFAFLDKMIPCSRRAEVSRKTNGLHTVLRPYRWTTCGSGSKIRRLPSLLSQKNLRRLKRNRTATFCQGRSVTLRK